MGGTSDGVVSIKHRWFDQFEKYEKIYVFCVNLQGMILANHLKLIGKDVEYLDNDVKKNQQLIVGQKCILPGYADKQYPCIIAAVKEKNKKDIYQQLLQIGFINIFFIDKEYKHEWVDCYAPLMSDELYLKISWYLKMGGELDLDCPHTFNEKIQWLKLHDRNPKYIKMADKYEVKQYVEETIGKEYIVPTLGIWNSFDEIDFDMLPDQFVLKCTHDCGSIVVCKDKSCFDRREAKRKINKCLRKNCYWAGREWCYKDIPPRIIGEKYLENDPVDYKIMCFNGKARCSFACTERATKEGLKVTFFDENWKRMPFERHYPSSQKIIDKPEQYKKMLVLAEKLASEIPFVRVDFYEINGKIYFGELTFYPGNGFEEFTPESADLMLGEWIKLPRYQ